MRTTSLIMIGLIACLPLQAQTNKDRVSNLWQLNTIDKTSITVTPDGIPVYFAVLRLNGKVIDVRPFSINEYNNTYSLGESHSYRIPKDLFSAEQIVDLISKYGFRLEDNLLIKNIRKASSQYDSNTELPPYLTYRIEKLTLL